MIEHTRPSPHRDAAYCWICCEWDCDNAQRSTGNASPWSPDRVTMPMLTGDRPWSWLNGPPAEWWYSTSTNRAA